jgi:hypothetical protein
MATTAGFKQQCPSCEAWVPIKDTKLVGRKIDCPKCKYRFVVEDPAAEEESDEEVEAPKPAKRPRRGEEDDKASAAKQKPTKRRAGEDDEEEPEKKPAKAGAGLSPKLVLGVGLGVVAVLVLGAVFYFVFLGGESTPTAGNTPSTPPPPPPPAAAPKAEATPLVSANPVEMISNLLPPETEGICNINMSDLAKTPLGRVFFEMPGTFRAQALQQRTGLFVEDVDLFVQAWSFTHKWSLNVIHAGSPIKVEAVKAALRAKPAAEKIDNQEYFLLEPNRWLDTLGTLAFAAELQVSPDQVPKRSNPLAMRVYDAQTLIFADEAPLKDFLKVKWKFPAQKARPAVAKAGAPAQPQAPSAPSGAGGIGTMTSEAPKLSQAGGTAAETRAAATPAAPADDLSASTYLAIDPRLKSMLNRVQRRRPIVSLAVNTEAATKSGLPPLDLNTLDLKTVVQDSGILGAALHFKDGLMLTLGMDYPSEDIARKQEELLHGESGKELAARLTAALNSKVELEEDKTVASSNAAAPPPPPGGGTAPRGRLSRGGRGGRADGGDEQETAPQNTGEGGGGSNIAIGGMMAGALTNQPQAAKTPDKAGSSIKSVLQDNTVVLMTINLVDQPANTKFLNSKVKELMVLNKGAIDMAVAQFGVHELGAAARTYSEAHQAQFPRGSAERKAPSNRAGRPYPPDRRVSWMAELLPHLGPEPASLYSRIDHDKSWRDPDNLGLASTLVPQFLDPANPPLTWWVRYPGEHVRSAATHYVGIAGIGLDAAEYKADDPATANKLGVFGYDRVTRLADIKDRASNTIMIAEVPTTFKRPWMAGGGATIQGVPDKGSVLPFVSTQRDGKRGTYVIFADGHVGFVSENISDDVFKALCTINAGESVIPDRDAPKVLPNEERTLEASPLTTPAPAPAAAPGKPSGR